MFYKFFNKSISCVEASLLCIDMVIRKSFVKTPFELLTWHIKNMLLSNIRQATKQKTNPPGTCVLFALQFTYNIFDWIYQREKWQAKLYFETTVVIIIYVLFGYLFHADRRNMITILLKASKNSSALNFL